VEVQSDALTVYTPGLGFKLPKRLYANCPLFHHLINRQIARRVTRFALRRQAATRVLVSFQHDNYELMRRPEFDYKLCICNDVFGTWGPIWKGSPLRSFQRALSERYERRTARQADEVLAVCEALRDKLRKANPRVDLLLPAHEFDEYPGRKVHSGAGPIRVAFMGFINRRLKMDWLGHLAAQKDMMLDLIGPLDGLRPEAFASFTNVRLLEPMHGSELLKELSSKDVLIMPYDVSFPGAAVTNAPNKLFQYLAAGCPIVISDMPSFLPMPANVVYRARSQEEFVQAIRQAYREDSDELVQWRIRTAKANAWDRRGHDLHERVERGLASKRCAS
jgi:glycosyltransferase involved in cell wall biosynthesis